MQMQRHLWMSQRLSRKKNQSATKKKYSNKNEIELLSNDFQILREEVKAGLAETKSELKTEINKLIIWIVGTFLAGGSLMILIAKLFFEK